MEFVRSSNGQQVSLALARTLGVGGEARVYALTSAPNLAAKIYHRTSPEREAKLAAMLANPPEDPMAGQGHVSIAWPSELLRMAGGGEGIVGFLMPMVRGMSPVIDFYHPRTRRLKHPLFNYQYLLRTARNLATCVGALHARGYVIGDLNESNILTGETALVTLVDTDSFQVPDTKAGRVYRCRVGKPEFTPPELQGLSFEWVDRQPEHDLFGLTVLIFQLLMEGVHPFAGRHTGAGEPPPLEERIAKCMFPHVPGQGGGILPMPTAPDFKFLDKALQELFTRCFIDGHAAPGKRPDAQLWQQALREAESALATCPANEQHHFARHLTACPWCQRRRRLGGLDPFPSREAVRRHEHLKVNRKWYQLRPAVPQDPRKLDYDTAVAIAYADIVRQRLSRRLLLIGCSLAGAGLLAFWVWAIRLALSGS